MSVDTFVGHLFGGGNQLEVLPWQGDRAGTGKLYPVKCSICSSDVELFGSEYFKMTKHDILVGRVPCGCSLKPVHWSKYQYEVRVRRLSEVKGYVYKGFSGDWRGNKTCLDLTCVKCSHEWCTTNISRFLDSGQGCPACARRDTASGKIKPEEDFVRNFIATGKFAEGTVFRRIKSGNFKQWEYECGVCSSDKYVQNGLCSGVFRSYMSSLAKGGYSCRCSSNFHWSREQAKFNLENLLSGSKYSFVAWSTVGKFTARARLTLNCSDHGTWETDYVSVTSAGTRCPSCAKSGGSY